MLCSGKKPISLSWVEAIPCKLLDLFEVGRWGEKACGVCITFREYVFDVLLLKQKAVEKFFKTLTQKTKAYK